MEKLFLFFVVASMFFASSCQKTAGQEEPIVTETATKYATVKFQINGKAVIENDFYAQLMPDQATLRDKTSQMSAIADKYRILGEFGRTDADGNKVDIVNAFTDIESYYAYADANGHTKEREIDAVIQDLAGYAVTSGAIAECQATGAVPKYYTAYMDASLTKLGLQPSTAPEVQLRTLTNFVYKDCFGTGNSWPIRTNPYLAVFGFILNRKWFSDFIFN